jgi:hypothetical protein
MNSLRSGALTVSEADHALWHLITEVPKVHPIIAWVCLALNIFVPGLGSIIIGAMGDRSTGGLSKA